MQKLYKKGIITQIHYIPILNIPSTEKYVKVNFLELNYISHCLSLPIYPDLKIVELKKIINNIKIILQKYKND